MLLLAGHHGWCGRLLKAFEAGTNGRSHRWFRVFNELPVLGLVAAGERTQRVLAGAALLLIGAYIAVLFPSLA